METTAAQRRPSFSEALRALPVRRRIWVVTRFVLFAGLFFLAIIGPIAEADFAPSIEQKKQYIERFYGLPPPSSRIHRIRLHLGTCSIEDTF
jgi:hypothetical protein